MMSGDRKIQDDIADRIMDALGVSLLDVSIAAGQTLPSNAPAELRAATARLELLYREKPRAFQSVSRTIDDWLSDAAPEAIDSRSPRKAG
jgi:hypothetical protein